MTSFYTGKVVEIDYTNWKGERRYRRVVPRDMWFGISRWHHERQWFLRAWCLESNEQREFCMATIHDWRSAALKAKGPTPKDIDDGIRTGERFSLEK
jgi:predicted DNA-binding transcriptional regulator YafY